MPLADRTLSLAAAEQVCAQQFEPADRQRFGIEIEWPVYRAGDVTARPCAEDLEAFAAAVLPAGGRATVEPGGQVELSTQPHDDVTTALRAARTDEAALRTVLRARGWDMCVAAVDGLRPPRRVLDRPRYAAMEQFFAAQGGAGALMMCNTASTQVNVSHAPNDPGPRWRTMHLISPVLIACFANSPGVGLDRRRWACLRQGIWSGVDPARTRPVRSDLPPAPAWLDYALNADVMFVCDEDSGGTSGAPVAPGLRFGAWLRDGHELGWPTLEDFRYHLSTLFCPVRPRGWLELRVLDALPEWIRDVAALTVAVSVQTDASRDLSRRLPDTSGWWTDAARLGLTHPTVAAAARELFRVVARYLDQVTEDAELSARFHEFQETFVERGRCPGDETAPLDLTAVAATSE